MNLRAVKRRKDDIGQCYEDIIWDDDVGGILNSDASDVGLLNFIEF